MKTLVERAERYLMEHSDDDCYDNFKVIKINPILIDVDEYESPIRLDVKLELTNGQLVTITSHTKISSDDMSLIKSVDDLLNRFDTFNVTDYSSHDDSPPSIKKEGSTWNTWNKIIDYLKKSEKFKQFFNELKQTKK